MNPNPKTPPAPPVPMFSVRDVYYIFFRHKWLIGAIALAGIIASAAYRQLYPVYYTSEAKLMIKYIVDTKPLTETGEDAQVTSTATEDSILSAEIDMLTSLNVAKDVAQAIGPAKILPPGQGTNLMQAAFTVQHGLYPDRARNSDVIRLKFSHSDRDQVVPILSQIITSYKTEHDEVRRPKSDEGLSEAIDHAKTSVMDAEKRLLDERRKTDIVSLEDSQKAISMSIDKLQADLSSVEMDLQVESVTVKDLKKGLPATAQLAVTNNPAPVTNQPAPIPPDVLQEYRRDNTILSSARNKETEYLTWTTTENREVQALEAQIAKTEKRIKQLEEANPGLVAVKPVAPGPVEADPAVAYNRELRKVQELSMRYQMLTNQLTQAKAKEANIEAEEGPILDLQRECARLRATLNFYQQRQEEAQVNHILEPGNSQIQVIEDPTPAIGDYVKVNKTCTSVLLGGLFFALAIPFTIEFYLDQSLKRPSDVQSRLGVPFFVSMPKLKTKSKRSALKPAKKALNPTTKVPLLPENAGEVPLPEAASSVPDPTPPPTNGHIAPWDSRHALRPFFETLRDRLMTYFEVINLTHKPKLVAVSSCREGAGVTTTAAGLASALSETGDGNVLLVNMNVRDGEAHHFYRGKLTCGLEEALEKDKRNAACIQDNLFIAKDHEINDNLPRVLPKRFSHLVPKMRASDYDYIIFDMPAMSQISITPRLARYMDMVLLVIESEKTDRDVAKRATDLLLEAKCNVGVVLNKSREYLPRRLQQDI